MHVAPFVVEGLRGSAPSVSGEKLMCLYDGLGPKRVRSISSSNIEVVVKRKYPTDVFLWGYGEAPDRLFTKVGGLPYELDETSWPIVEGRPATFLAQFNFTDSEDVVRLDLPGEILLVYVRDGVRYRTHDMSFGHG